MLSTHCQYGIYTTYYFPHCMNMVYTTKYLPRSQKVNMEYYFCRFSKCDVRFCLHPILLIPSKARKQTYISHNIQQPHMWHWNLHHRRLCQISSFKLWCHDEINNNIPPGWHWYLNIANEIFQCYVLQCNILWTMGLTYKAFLRSQTALFAESGHLWWQKKIFFMYKALFCNSMGLRFSIWNRCGKGIPF